MAAISISVALTEALDIHRHWFCFLSTINILVSTRKSWGPSRETTETAVSTELLQLTAIGTWFRQRHRQRAATRR